ncbi:MAG: SulP family inorganic anion transporter [Paracoccaceae bacterium]|nr:SulP family inorganic anion transporter [Paracoccaceae bacterium]
MITAIKSLCKEMYIDARGKKALPAVSNGIVSAVTLIIAQTAFGTLIFSDALAQYTSQGVGLILFGNFIALLIMALISSFRGVIVGLSPVLVIFMATIANSVNTTDEALFVTVYAVLAFSAVIIGVCCLLIGHYRLAAYIRFIPYPVASGFVSGLGATVCIAAVSLMGVDLTRIGEIALMSTTGFWIWFPGLAYGTGLYLAIRKWRNPHILTTSVLLLIVGYNLILYLLDISIVEAGDRGFLLESTVQGRLWPPFTPEDFLRIDWSILFSQIHNILTLIMIAFIYIILNFSGLELAVNQELDWNKEFNATGISTVVSGLSGGTCSTIYIPPTLRSKILGATTRLTGLIAACVVLIAILYGGSLLAYFPTALIGGILIFAGLGLLEQGLQDIRKGLPWSELGIVIGIFLAILFIGLIEGVIIGLLVAFVLFGIKLSRIKLIETQFNLRDKRSNRSYSVSDLAILQEVGGRGVVYQLRGYIFFGNITSLIDQLKDSLAGLQTPDCLLLDCSAITGYDYSAVNSLSLFFRLASRKGVTIVLSAAPARLNYSLERNLTSKEFSNLEFKENLDQALEYCEDLLISNWKKTTEGMRDGKSKLLERASSDLERHLDRQVEFERLIDELEGWLTARDYQEGEIISEGSSEGEIKLLFAGGASVQDRARKRLSQLVPGDVITTLQGYGIPSSSIFADKSCQVMELSSSTLGLMEKQDPDLALKLYRYLTSRFLNS